MGYDMERALRRNVEFMSDPAKTGALIRVGGFGQVALPGIDALETFDFPREITKFCDQTIANCLAYKEARKDIDDDWLPALKPYMGIAEHSCFMGGGVSYGGNTSYHHPPLNDITEWTGIKLDPLHPHYKMLLDGMAYLQEKSKSGEFYVSLRGGDGPMDIANAVRGNDLLYDFYDEPEAVKEFTAFCAEGTRWTFENQRPFASKLCGGYISGMSVWMPGNCIGHISEDASCLCSVEMYREFGLPFTRKLLENYDYAMLHVHSLGRADIPAFAEMDKLQVFQLSGDPNQPSGLEVYKEYADTLTGRVVLLDMTPAEIYASADFLKGRRTIINTSAPSVDEARRIVDFVRTL